MTDIPIIFSAPMVRAWLEGRKSMTRRLLYGKRKVKGGMIPASTTMLEGHPPPRGKLSAEGFPTDIAVDEYWALTGWHKVKPGDLLWVREHVKLAPGGWRYAADDTSIDVNLVNEASHQRALAMVAWAHHQERESVPSIHMPRILSRLTLIVGATKIEPLQDISKADVIAEGVTERDGLPLTDVHAGWHEPFAKLWDSLHGSGAWDRNPEVVAITAKVIKANIDAAEARAA